LEILGQESLTERSILRQIGDNRYSREIIRKLLQDGLIYRVGKVRMSCLPFQPKKITMTAKLKPSCAREAQRILSNMLLQISMMAQTRQENLQTNLNCRDRPFVASLHCLPFSLICRLLLNLGLQTKKQSTSPPKYTHFCSKQNVLSPKPKFDIKLETTPGRGRHLGTASCSEFSDIHSYHNCFT